jgi:lysophospholipase L1-like esterase
MPTQNYQDGYHLNAAGATLFSHRLAEYILAQR